MTDPHRDSLVESAGLALEKADGVVILLHGRGGSAQEMLALAPQLSPAGLAFLAPQAYQNTWYPHSFLAPLKQNEPWLTSALARVQAVVQRAVDAGFRTDAIAIGGFSQGACLATEFVARYPARYAALLAFTGGLIGPEGADLHHSGNLSGMPAFFGSGDPDPHVPWSRVEDSARSLEQMGAEVITRRYAGRPHTVTRDELEIARSLISRIEVRESGGIR